MNDHPEIESLKSYLNNSAATEFNDLRLHLAQCSQCRTEVEGLIGLQKITELSASNSSDNDVLSEQQHQLITDYIDGRLSEAEFQQQKEFLQSNPAAMKAALHYASHKSAMDRSISESLKKSTQVSSSDQLNSSLWVGLLIKFKSKAKSLANLQTPVWLTVPVAATLVALLTINLFNQPITEQPLVSIARYQDNAIIQFRSKEQIPGIGFFAKSTQLSKSYAGVSVSIAEDKYFKLQWPSVPDAIKYNIRLQMFDQGNKIVMGEVATEKNSAVITVDIDDISHRYEWVLSGETSDARVFFANGGFVISKARIEDLHNNQSQKDNL